MKIGFVLDDSLDKTDGVQQYVITLGTWLSHHGHDVHYLVGETRRKDIRNIHSLSRNIQVHFNQNRMTTPLPAKKSRIKKLLDDAAFDVLHVQMPYSPLLAGKIISQCGSKTAIIGTFHIIPFSRLEKAASKLLGIWSRRTLRRFDQILSVSDPAKRFAKQAFKIDSQVLPNVVALQEFRQAKQLRKYRDRTKTIVYLGRLVERKGCLQLLKAIQVLHEQDKLTDVRVLICGKGPLLERLKSYVRQHGLGHVVRFEGFLSEEDKASYLKRADIAVFPSTGGESFGIVLIEAMAAGAGVVLAGNNVGYSSVMDGRPEQLVDPNKTRQFADTLWKYMSHSKWQQKAHDWQEQAVTRYDIAHVGPELVSVYENALKSREQGV